jgi:toxin ParE1/3/4
MLAASIWLDSREPGLGARFLDAVDAAVKYTIAFPSAARRDEFGLKRKVISRFPYTIIYETKAGTLQILAVAHHQRDERYWRERASGDIAK